MKVELEQLHEGFDKSLTWRGKPIWKNPVDLLVYQMIARDVKPTIVIETGTHLGGSAEFWLDMMDGEGRVITIDIEQRCSWRRDESILALEGTSTSREVVEAVARCIDDEHRVLVNLDSSHRYLHVLDELETFSPFVTLGSYLIVEDGIDDFQHATEGPHQATLDWIVDHPEFAIDKEREQPGWSNCPDGFLRKVSGS